jgi:hypothetical protein
MQTLEYSRVLVLRFVSHLVYNPAISCCPRTILLFIHVQKPTLHHCLLHQFYDSIQWRFQILTPVFGAVLYGLRVFREVLHVIRDTIVVAIVMQASRRQQIRKHLVIVVGRKNLDHCRGIARGRKNALVTAAPCPVITISC